MYNIISNLLVLLQVQQKIISILFLLATSKPLKYDSSQSCDKVPYHRIVIDQMPVIKEVKKFDYTQLLSEYLQNTGKVLKPVKRHENSKNSVPENLRCPCCNAPSEYIYDNNGGRGSFQCKICKSTFNHKSRFSKQVQLKCPHCGRALSRMKERSCFYIWKCTSLDCSFYKDNLNSPNAYKSIPYFLYTSAVLQETISFSCKPNFSIVLCINSLESFSIST